MSIVVQGDREDIILENVDWSLSSPYKLPTSDFWHMSIKPKGNEIKTKYILTFVNRIRAEVFKKGNVNTFRFVKFTVVVGGNIDILFMPNQKDMDLYVDKMAKGYKSTDTDKDKKKYLKDVFSNEISEQELFGDDIDGGSDVNLNDMMEAWEDFYEEKSLDATTKAKTLLLSISNHYLTKEIMNNDLYVRNKLMIQAESLSMLFVQLSLTKQVLMKFFKEIMSDIGNKSVYEAFAQQQKFVLEINTFLNKTIKEIIDDMQQAKARHIEIEKEKQQELENSGMSDTSTLKTRDRKKMIGELELMIGEIEEGLETYTEEDVVNMRKLKEEKLNISGDDDFNNKS